MPLFSCLLQVSIEFQNFLEIMFTITIYFLFLLELSGRNGMFMNFLETGRSFFHRRSWKPVEHSLKLEHSGIL